MATTSTAPSNAGFFQTPWADRGKTERIIILSGSIAGVITTGVLINRGIKNVQERKIAKTYGGDLKTLNKVGIKPSYLDSQYLLFADTLYQAMDSSLLDWGTDEWAVNGVMKKMRNDADVNKLITAFGKKDGYTLAQWIGGDFSAPDKDYYINEHLRKNGIEYQF